MGSVKDLEILKMPSDSPGIGRFHFSDRYSVFDYGDMPDLIENKGKALCLISAFFFETMERRDIKTHYVGVVEKGRIKKIDELDEPVDVMEIRLVNVYHPEKTEKGYDYAIFKKLKGNFLIPLEVIYRNSLPEGSSVYKRIERGELTLDDLGIEKLPNPRERLLKPLIDFSTKLEDVDRYLTKSEAKEISGMSDEEFNELINLSLEINDIITTEVGKAGIENEDGKIEFAFDERRELMVVDSVGTPDECRFSFDGVEISKEVLRRYYRKTDWYRRIEKVRGEKNWRKIVGKPPRLSQEVKKLVSEMYMSACNEITGLKFFDSPSLRDVAKSIAELMGDLNG